jgi:hypothetical protein
MLIAEVVIGLQQDGLPALGMLLVEATRLIVFAGFLWAAGDLAVLLIESNHDLRASPDPARPAERPHGPWTACSFSSPARCSSLPAS